MLQEPVLHGTVLDFPGWLALGQVVGAAGPRLEDSACLACRVGLRSGRIASHLLEEVEWLDWPRAPAAGLLLLW